MTEQLASVPEEITTGFGAPCPPLSSYCESIRSVAWPEWRIRSTLSSESDQSGSNYSSNSGASTSYLSNISVCSVDSASASAADFGSDELRKIAYRMVSEGYTQSMVHAFKYGNEQDGALETWFTELDINWVFQLNEKYDCWQQPLLYGASASRLQEFAERWIRALTIIIVSIKEMVTAVDETPAVARFGKASISAMLVFVDALVSVSNVEKLPAMLQMYVCISNASPDMSTMHLISSDAQRIFNDIGALLERKGNMLIRSMSKTMSDVKIFMKDKNKESLVSREGYSVVDTTEDDWWWAIEITRGGGEVHKNTRFMVDCIVLMGKALASALNSAEIHNTAKLRDLIRDNGDMLDYLKDLLLRKSELCLDPSLRYLFLLNNSYFVSQVFEPSISLDVGHLQGLQLTPECANYMNSYIKVSWEDVLSCLWSSNFHGPFCRWIDTSSLNKFQLAFLKTYRAQKFWKVSDPRLRYTLRSAIIERVISGYRYYLKENPELEKKVSSGSNSPEVFEEMLGELFEG